MKKSGSENDATAKMSIKKKRTIGIIIASWVIALAAVFSALAYHQFDEGDRGPGVENLNTGMTNLLAANINPVLEEDLRREIGARANQPVGIVFLHPHCPCSKSTINEIERMLSKPEYHNTQIMFIAFSSSQRSKEWNHSALVAKAELIPGTLLFSDTDGRLATAFGAQISGEVLAFSSSGNLAFHGGVTASRGHEGPNPGIESLGQVLVGQIPQRSELPVYGCILTDIESTPDEHSEHAKASTSDLSL